MTAAGEWKGGAMPEKSIAQELREKGVSRREFLKLSGVIAGAAGLMDAPLDALGLRRIEPSERVAAAMETAVRVPVIWLEFQDCAGCTEAISRSQAPTLVDLVLNTLTIEYHETLSAAAGFQVEQAKRDAMEKYKGKYVLVVEGSIPVAGGGVYCTVGGRTAMDLLAETAADAGAIIATGNCASFGGLPKASPNPTDARGVAALVKDKPIINIPGCPAIPEVTTGVIVQYVLFGLPKLDALGRPLAFYGNTIHDRCLRRPFYEAGKYAAALTTTARARAGACTSSGARGRPPTTPAPRSSGMPDSPSRSNPGIRAWDAPNRTSGTAAGSTRASPRRSRNPPSPWRPLRRRRVRSRGSRQPRSTRRRRNRLRTAPRLGQKRDRRRT